MSTGMSTGRPQQSRGICHRCFQPVPVKAASCANCGERVNSFRQLPILVGILGVVALVFVIVIMFQVVRNVDIESAPPEQQQDNPGPSQSKSGSSSEPVNPDKPPPANR